ncbi:MAG: secondary thiamine-phosphate synthase enzyme YjbQ [bacterium]
MWIQRKVTLPAFRKGFHIIDAQIAQHVPELKEIKNGLLHLQLMHTSASLSINESADPDVRTDMNDFFHQLVPEHLPYFRHTSEGADDMPAHIKSSLLGCSVSIPVHEGQLMLGTWQAIYLGEHRSYGGQRNIYITLHGDN